MNEGYRRCRDTCLGAVEGFRWQDIDHLNIHVDSCVYEIRCGLIWGVSVLVCLGALNYLRHDDEWWYVGPCSVQFVRKRACVE